MSTPTEAPQAAEGPRPVAVVTGAGAGLGKAFARLWLERHGPVVGLDLDPTRVEWLEEHPDAAGIAGDVTDPAVSEALVHTAEERFGRVDAAVLAAGISAWGHVEELGIDVYDRVMDVNVRGVLHGLRAAAPALRRAGGGSVVVISSTSGTAGEPDHWAYCTSKAAVTNLARSAAMDLAPDRIRVNVVAPGPTHTELTRPIKETNPDKYHQLRINMPMQRWGEQEEVAEAIAFLAGPASSFITAAVLPVDGGMTGRTPQLPAPPLTA